MVHCHPSETSMEDNILQPPALRSGNRLDMSCSSLSELCMRMQQLHYLVVACQAPDAGPTSLNPMHLGAVIAYQSECTTSTSSSFTDAIADAGAHFHLLQWLPKRWSYLEKVRPGVPAYWICSHWASEMYNISTCTACP